MPSYTSSLRLIQPTTGEYPGTWGSQVNTGLTALVDNAVAGTATIAVGSTDYTLSTVNGAADESRAAVLSLTAGAGVGARNIICPAVSKLYTVVNSSGFTQTVKTAAGTGVAVPTGTTAFVRCDGTNVVTALNYFGSLTLGAALPTSSGGTGSTSTTYCSLTANVTGTLPVANGGTGVTSSTGTGSVVLSTSPTLVTPLLGTPTSGTLTNCTGLPISTGVSGLGSGVAIFLATPTSANLAAAVTGETGSGALVFATSPTLVTPALGTPSSGTLTNCTGLPLNTGVSGVLSVPNGGTGVTSSTGTGSVVLSNSPSFITPNLGTPASGNLSACTSYLASNLSGLGANVATFLGTPTSANLAAAVTDETGSGALVFATSPTLVTPALGTPSSGTLTNCTGLPISTGVSGLGTGVTTALAVNTGSSGAFVVNGGVLGTPSSGTATNLTGLPLTTGVTGTLPVANGGTGVTTSTGSGNNVLSTSPTLVTPILGTPTSGTLTSCTGLPLTTGVTGTLPLANGGTGQTTAQAAINSLAGAVTSGQYLRGNGTNVVMSAIQAADVPTLNQNTTGTAANVTGTVAVANGGTGVTTSTGSGSVVLSTSPALTTPNLGTPSAATLTNATGLPLTTGVTGTLGTANGGTGLTAFTASQIFYASSTSAVAQSAGLTFDGTNFATTGTSTGAKFIPTGNNVSGNGMYLPATNTLAWSTNSTQRAQITSGGYLKVSNSGTYQYSATSTHEFNNNASGTAAGSFYASNAAYAGSVVVADTTRTASASFILFNGLANGIDQFYVQGDGVVYAQNTTIQSLSDRRLKENVQSATDGLSVVLGLRPVRYDWKPGYGNDRKNQLGFIAQEVEAVFPDAVSTWKSSDDPADPYKTVGPGALIPVLVKAIQEQQALIEDLRARVAALEAA